MHFGLGIPGLRNWSRPSHVPPLNLQTMPISVPLPSTAPDSEYVVLEVATFELWSLDERKFYGEFIVNVQDAMRMPRQHYSLPLKPPSALAFTRAFGHKEERFVKGGRTTVPGPNPNRTPGGGGEFGYVDCQMSWQIDANEDKVRVAVTVRIEKEKTDEEDKAINHGIGDDSCKMDQSVYTSIYR